MALQILLFLSGVVEDTGADGGSSSTFLWILIFIIIVLATIILVRDRKIREKVSGFFKLIGNKVKVARINSKIKKEEQSVSGLIEELGKKAWEKDLEINNGEEVRTVIKKELVIKETLGNEMNEISKKIEKNKDNHNSFVKNMESKIKNEEEQKDPLDEKLKKQEKDLFRLEKELTEAKKKIEKLEKSIEKNKSELERLNKDQLLDDEERNDRIGKAESILRSSGEELPQKKSETEKIKDEIKLLTGKNETLRTGIEKFEKRISEIRDEIKTAEKLNDKKVKELLSEKGKCAAEISRNTEKLSVHYKKFGSLFDRSRQEDPSLFVIYSEIDQGREKIKNLKTEKEEK